MKAYSDQDHNTTAIYVDHTRTEQFDGNGYADEQYAIARMRGEGKIFVERIVFGHGRVALMFRTRKFQ